MSKLHASLSLAIGVLGAAMMFAATPTSVAAAPKEKPAKEKKSAAPPGWTVNCTDRGKGLECKAEQTITFRQTRQRLLTVSVGRNDKGKSGTALLHLPYGLFLPDGVQFAIDTGKPQTLPVQTCDGGGCYAAIKLEAKDLKTMQSGKKLAVTFANLEKRKITVEVPLAGFAAAFKKLK